MIKNNNNIAFYLVIITILLLFGYIFIMDHPDKTKPGNGIYKEPTLNIGCSYVTWIQKNVTLSATVSNMMGNITYQWWIDGILNSSDQKIITDFTEGGHLIRVEVSNETLKLEKNITMTAVSTTDDISIKPIPSETYGMWRFQAYLVDVYANIPGIRISINNEIIGTSGKCTPVKINGMRAGKYDWSAEYHGQIIGGGTIEVPEIQAISISSLNIAPQYKTGDTISTELIIMNIGTQDIKGFHTITEIINNDYAWMGDAAIREYNIDYMNVIAPGGSVEIPIKSKIPEKVKGIRPTGHYTINIEIIYDETKTYSITKQTRVT